MTEQQLLKDCLNGSAQAQKRLYEMHARKMFGVCLRYASDRNMAEDFLQEGFIRVFTKLGSFKSQGSLEGWIRRIMVNTSLELLRKNDVFRLSVEFEDLNIVAEEEDDTPEPINAEVLLNHIQEMPSGFRTVFNLYAVEDFSHKEIGKMLNISEGTSKSQYARARTWLQKRLKNKK